VLCLILFNKYFQSLKCLNKRNHWLVIYAYVCEFGENIFTTDGTVLYYKICNLKVSAEKKFTVNHVTRDKHIMGIEKKINRKYLKLRLH